jgi:site-specific recombinase XerD
VVTDNIRNLEGNARSVFAEHGFSEHTIVPMLFIIRAITRLHIEQGEERFNVDIADNYLKQHEKRYQNGKITRYGFHFYRNTIERLAQICDSGTIIIKRHTIRPELPEHFEHLLSRMFADEKWASKLGKHQYRHVRAFLQWLYSRGHTDLGGVDEKVVGEYLADCSIRMVGVSLYGTRAALKDLLLFVSEDGIIPESLNKLFLFRIPIEKKIKPFIPQEEIAAILNVIDRTTLRGKRDYAIILLAAVTGLRGIDIVNLTLDSIDWRNGEIKIVQQKTDKALALPLTTDTGKAIHEYILSARPHSQSDKVFLNSRAPFGAMHSSTLNINLGDYCVKAKLQRRHSFYSLRRSIATSMVVSGVSVITVAQALGQRTLDSTKQYISLDSKNLKECALDFRGIQIGGDMS